MPHGLSIPTCLTALVNDGSWPRTYQEAEGQNLRSRVNRERIRVFAPDENVIYLLPPPFVTVANVAATDVGDFWLKFGSLDQIDPALSLIIADFEIGSDSMVILDYRHKFPPVLRLRWSGKQTQWVSCARDFDEFADLLGLESGGQDASPS